MKNLAIKLIPWVITIVALYYAFSGLEWGEFFGGLLTANYWYILLAILLTASSYLMRSFRWQYFFPEGKLAYAPAAEVLFLGFFMNNILPARAGEFVRAHFGSKKFNCQRTLVLATIASERLVDGLTISAFFLLAASNLVHGTIARNLLWVVGLFFGAGFVILILLVLRKNIFAAADRISNRFNHRFTVFLNSRLQVFLEGLKPIYQPSRFPKILLSSAIVWLLELAVYASVSMAFGAYFGLPTCVLFLVAVNFSSLIPSAPGAIGVIEAVSTAVLVSVGIDKHTALAMVVSQHIIQYLVVGVPGLWVMLLWKVKLDRVEESATC